MPFIAPPDERSQSNDHEPKAMGVGQEIKDAASIANLHLGPESRQLEYKDDHEGDQEDSNEDDAAGWDIIGKEEIEQDRAWFQYGQRDTRSREQEKTYRGHYHVDVGWGRWKVRVYEINWTISGEYPQGCGRHRMLGNDKRRREENEAEDEEEREDEHEDEHDDEYEDERDKDKKLNQHKSLA